MQKQCDFCGKNRATSKNRRQKEIPPHRRFFHPFYSVYFPAKYGDKILKVCRTCFKGGKVIHIFYPAKT